MKVFQKNRANSFSHSSSSRNVDSPRTESVPDSSPSRVRSATAPRNSLLAISLLPNGRTGLNSAHPISDPSPSQVQDSSGLPGYAPRPQALAVPSYDDSALNQSLVEDAVIRRELASPSDGQRFVRDYFGTSQSNRQQTTLEEGVEEEVEDDDDPLTPRPLRPPPQPSLVPLRRATLPIMPRVEPISPTEEPASSTVGQAQLPLELPAPPANALPPYNPHLAHDELRLISSVHLDQNHPAAAFFSAMTTSMNRGNHPSHEGIQAEELTSGGKKLRVTITRGGHTMDNASNGPIHVRLGRGGTVEGRIDIGKVTYGLGLEVSVSTEIRWMTQG